MVVMFQSSEYTAHHDIFEVIGPIRPEVIPSIARSPALAVLATR